MEHDRPIIVETEGRSNVAAWAVVAIVAIAIIVGALYLMQTSGSEVAKDNAIANAANNVGEAANDVGDAAKVAADNVTHD